MCICPMRQICPSHQYFMAVKKWSCLTQKLIDPLLKRSAGVVFKEVSISSGKVE